MTSEKRETLAVILAAGKGTRMKSDLPKVLHTILGKPLVSFVIDACNEANVDRTMLVIGHEADLVKTTIGTDVEYTLQTEQLGTGHALMMAAKQLGDNYKGDVLVLVGDAPFLTGKIISELIDKHQQTAASATMMTAIIDPPPAYGRIVRDAKNRVTRIVEQRDASDDEKKITEVNTSHYCFRSEDVFPLLHTLGTDNDQGEYYLTDIIAMLADNNALIETITEDDPDVLKGINDKTQLLEAQEDLKCKKIESMRNNDVIIPDADQIFIDADVSVGSGTVIYPFTSITGKCSIGKNCIIGPQTTLKDTKLGDGCKVELSIIEKRNLQDNTHIGPFASVSGE
ncbi:NTP transferase domain-containing protein [bacterium]|nr:NTP transferase domain-containing protein [bacterium]